MALEYVGGNANGNPGADATVDLTALTGGLASSPSEGDCVYVMAGTVDLGGNEALPSTGGYSEIASIIAASRIGRLSRKFMGATPDSSVTVNNNGAGTDGLSVSVHVWRGVDQTTPEDATPTTAASNDGPAITTVTDGAVVLSMVVRAFNSTLTAPTGYSNLETFPQLDTNRCVVGLASKAIPTATTEDPGAWNFGDGTITNAIRPAAEAGGETVVLDTGTISATGTDIAADLAAGLDAGSVGVTGIDLSPDTAVALDQGAVNVSGADLSARVSLLLDTGTASIAGNDISIQAGETVNLDSGTVSLSGLDLTAALAAPLDQGTVIAAGNDLAADLAALLDIGVISVTGQDLRADLLATLDAGSALVTGNDITPTSAVAFLEQTKTRVYLAGDFL